MVVNDVWGQIRIEPEYEAIINSKEFSELKNKTQLGLHCNSNAIHTRYQHSIGVYYLACKLIEICNNKFSNVLKITKEDEQAIKCAALVHDIGHGCFSHVSERHLEGTHENRTVSILLDKNSEVHKAIVNTFGERVLEKTIASIKMKENIKDINGVSNGNSLMLINSKLLSGGIDIDRIDYIFRDSKFVLGETNDFSSILESISLECIDDSLEIVFDESAEFTIANYFNKRFELYDSLYLDNETRILEDVFGKFIKKIDKNLTWETTETEIKNAFRENINNQNIVISRYAKLLNNKKLDSGFIIREINNINDYNYYKERLFENVPEIIKYSECIFESSCKIAIYNKDNKVFINKSGLITDISECSKILNSELNKEKYGIAVDTTLLKELLMKDKVDNNTINAIINKVIESTSIEIEQEKKYIFKTDNVEEIRSGFNLIKNKLKLSNPEYIENLDVYYDYNDILESKRIAVRKRFSKGKECWNVKRPLKDMTSISKRNEKKFSSIEEVIFFLNNQWGIPINELNESGTLKTLREKYDIKFENGLFEIVFDATDPFINGEKLPTNYMIECELKDGSSSGLYFLNEIMKTFDFIEECNLSKMEIASRNNPVNEIKESPIAKNVSDSKYAESIKNIFISSPDLLDKLRVLNEKKEKIVQFKEKYGNLKKPIVVTINGTPRSGKTTCINNLYEFLKKANLNTVCLDEPAEVIYKTLKTKKEKSVLLSDRVGFVEKQYEMGLSNTNQNILGNDIILSDRGFIDPFVWYDMYFKLNMMDKERYIQFNKQLKRNSNYYSYLYSLFSNSDESMRRDYLNSLSIEPRTTMSKENVELYNSALLRLFPTFEKTFDCSRLIDTTKNDRIDASILTANELLDEVAKIYLKR